MKPNSNVSTYTAPNIMDKLIPYQAVHRTGDLISDISSDETKAQTARWFAEMMIKEFLSGEFSEESYKKLSLGDLISYLTEKVDKKIIDSLNFIKDFGDKASHYNPDVKITKTDSKKAVEAALDLFSLIIIDHLKKNPLDSHPDRATILSTTLPKIRLKIIGELIDFDDLSTDYQIGLLHKWCLACVKSGGREKVRRKLNNLQKKGKISKPIYDFEIKSVNEIAFRMSKSELPIPFAHEDFARNFDAVISQLSAESKEINSRLIDILDRMAKHIQRSEFGGSRGMQVFLV